MSARGHGLKRRPIRASAGSSLKPDSRLELVTLSDEKGSLYWKSFGMMQRGLLCAATGSGTDAVQTITSGLAALRLMGSTWSIPTFSGPSPGRRGRPGLHGLTAAFTAPLVHFLVTRPTGERPLARRCSRAHLSSLGGHSGLPASERTAQRRTGACRADVIRSGIAARDVSDHRRDRFIDEM